MRQRPAGRARKGGRDARLLSVLVAGALLNPALAAAQTRAGTAIDNTAEVRFQAGDAVASTRSNTVRLTVAERLDVSLTNTGPAATVADRTAWPVSLSNPGNGEEAYVLAAVAGGAEAAVAIDSDNDGRFDPAHDQLLAGRSPALAPGASVTLFVLAPAGTGEASIETRAVTASGAPGLVIAGAGDGGGDAVVGPTGAAVRLVLDAARATAAPQLLKSQSVLAPDGSTNPVSGAIVTYALEARFAAPAAHVRVEDPLPAGTRLVPGSLTLDGAPLTDAADGDAGSADPSGIAVALGDIAGPATRRVTFKVQLK